MDPMATDERRMLDALERLRVHAGGSSQRLLETPPRRKSSALSLSHLAAATPPIRTATGETPRVAVGDIARELAAVEARLSVFREVAGKEEQEQEAAVVERQDEKTQQAGEVADEVEHALANCDRLLQQAKLQASAASLTRSLRSNSRSQDPSPTALAAFVAVGKRIDDELELEATARVMRALVASREDEMAREEAVVVAEYRRSQAQQLKEIERKFESTKKMALLALREKCEGEARAAIKQAITTHEKAQEDALKKLEDKLLGDRERVLTEVLARHEADTEGEIKRLEIKLQGETLSQKQQLEKQLAKEHEDAIHQVELDAQFELQRWEQKQRLNMESDILSRREEAAAAILRTQEAKTSELKRQMAQQHTAKEAEELEKLRKALAFGAQAQLQQLRKQLDTDHDRLMSDTRTEAAQALEAKLTDLKLVLQLAHKQELENTRRDLEKKNRVAVMEMHERIENEHRAQVHELTTKAALELDETVVALRVELEQQNKAKLDALQQTLERDHRVRLHQLEMEQDRVCDEALDRLRRQLTETQQRELEAKLGRMQQNKAVLLDEAIGFLAIKPEDRRSLTATTPALLQLKQLQTHLPKELQRAVSSLIKDFEELNEEQQILVEKISDATGLYLTFKRQCAHLENEVNELQNAVQSLHTQLQTKDDLAKKLYMANEALLKKLGLADPS